MATVTTALTPAPLPFPYGGPRGENDQWAPLAEWRVASSDAIPLTGAADNQHVKVTISLPRGRAFFLRDLFVQMNSSLAGDATWRWPTSLYCAFQNAAIGSTASQTCWLELSSLANARASSTDVLYRAYSVQRMPGMIMVPLRSDVVTVEINAYNTTANDNAYTIACSARFLEYSFLQAYDWRVNANLPIR